MKKNKIIDYEYIDDLYQIIKYLDNSELEKIELLNITHFDSKIKSLILAKKEKKLYKYTNELINKIETNNQLLKYLNKNQFKRLRRALTFLNYKNEKEILKQINKENIKEIKEQLNVLINKRENSFFKKIIKNKIAIGLIIFTLFIFSSLVVLSNTMTVSFSEALLLLVFTIGFMWVGWMIAETDESFFDWMSLSIHNIDFDFYISLINI